MKLPDPDAVETPIGLVDVERTRRNARRAVEYLGRHGLRWRPHVKTHKSLRVARIQLDAGARGLTVATPREAEVMSAVSDDLLLAYPPVGASKLDRLMALPPSVELKVALDSLAVLDALAGAASSAGRRVGVLVEADLGMGRVGVGTSDQVVTLARAAAEAPGTDYLGLMFYPGHIRGPADRQDAGIAELNARLRGIYEALDDAGLPARVVSGGSTPTFWRSHEVEGLTEVRAGTWIFNDREQLSLGVAEREDLAYSVLATVVSVAVPGQAVVDAGSKALSREERGGDDGYGMVLDRPGVTVRALSEEHGILDLGGSDWRPAIGDRVRIVPNHVCVSVNLQDHVVALRDDGWDHWPLEGRGRGPVER